VQHWVLPLDLPSTSINPRSPPSAPSMTLPKAKQGHRMVLIMQLRGEHRTMGRP
jgi:hypothetical protein